MRSGKIARILDHRFGFISSEWHEVFFDRSAVEGGELRSLHPGDDVEYELVPDDDPHSNGPQACWVRPQRDESPRRAPAA